MNPRRLTRIAIVAIAGVLGGAETASAQWSGTNPITTLSTVGVGTTSPAGPMEVKGSNTPRLNVNDTAGSNANVGVRLMYNGTAAWSIAGYQSGSSPQTSNFQIFDDLHGVNLVNINTSFIDLNATTVPNSDNTFRLGTSGARWSQVWAANGTIQTSDRRLKKDIADIDYGLQEVLKLRPVTFKWKAGKDVRRHLGLIAQEVDTVIPESVVHGDKPEDPIGMNYSELVPLLIKAVQVQQKEIKRQGDQIAELKKDRGRNETAGSWGGAASLAIAPIFGLAMLAGGRWRLRKRTS